jgi:hypothetical protein
MATIEEQLKNVSGALQTFKSAQTAGVAIDPKTTTANSLTKASVPVATLENPSKPLNIPQTPQPMVDAKGAVGVAQTYLDQQAQEVANAQAPVSESENQIRELMGLRNQESVTKAELEKKAGLGQKTEAFNRIIANIQRQTANIQQFDDEAFFDVEEARLDAGKRDITKGVFGAKEQQMNLQTAIQRRAKVSELQGSLASASLLQGDLEAAREQIDSALAAIYDPIKQDILDEMFFLTRNDTRLTAAQTEQSAARQTLLQAQMDAITNAEKMVGDAVASGAATPEEVRQMQKLSGDPTAQAALAQQITARATYGDRQLSRQTELLQQENIRSQMADRVASRVVEQQAVTAKEAEGVQKALSVKSLIDGLSTSSALGSATGKDGVIRNKIPGSEEYSFARSHDQLKAALTIENLSALKGLGAMSDREFGTISNSVSKLDLGLSDTAYKAELDKINQSLIKTFSNAVDLGIMDETEFAVIVGLGEDDVSQISAYNSSLDDTTIAKFY